MSQVPYTKEQLAGPVPNYSGCFRQGPGQLASTSGSLCFYSGNMNQLHTYVLLANITKGARFTNSTLMITVTNSPTAALVTLEYDSLLILMYEYEIKYCLEEFNYEFSEYVF